MKKLSYSTSTVLLRIIDENKTSSRGYAVAVVLFFLFFQSGLPPPWTGVNAILKKSLSWKSLNFSPIFIFKEEITNFYGKGQNRTKRLIKIQAKFTRKERPRLFFVPLIVLNTSNKTWREIKATTFIQHFHLNVHPSFQRTVLPVGLVNLYFSYTY